MGYILIGLGSISFILGFFMFFFTEKFGTAASKGHAIAFMVLGAIIGIVVVCFMDIGIELSIGLDFNNLLLAGSIVVILPFLALAFHFATRGHKVIACIFLALAIAALVTAVARWKIDYSSPSFNNDYGTYSTKCAAHGCNNKIASSGDTMYCATHSNRCLNCNKYIDGDAMYCMSCLTEALS